MQATAAPTAPVRPVLTLPPAPAAALRRHYAAASVILEYGSGGSTVEAADLGKPVFSVESDAAWCGKMQAWFAANPGRARTVLHHADIGPTGEWGMPTDQDQYRKFPGYAQSVWDRDDFAAPDVVLVDGRFRVACFATTFLRTTRPVKVLFDDYADRPGYHIVERLAPVTAWAGRMAIFDLVPSAVPRREMAWIAASVLDPA